MQQLIKKIVALQTSPVVKRIEERAAAGLPADPKDSKAYHALLDSLIAENSDALAGLESRHMRAAGTGMNWRCTNPGIACTMS